MMLNEDMGTMILNDAGGESQDGTMIINSGINFLLILNFFLREGIIYLKV